MDYINKRVGEMAESPQSHPFFANVAKESFNFTLDSENTEQF